MHHSRFSPRCAAAAMVLAFASLWASPARSGVEVFNKEELSLELGLRIQPRMELAATSTGRGWQRDFLIRRARLKANGKVHRAKYVVEWKIDGTDQIGASPSAQIENCYLQYPLGWEMDLRAGLYDQPFSRDLLTSDSKQLAVDRGSVSSVPSALGLTDNAFGLQLQGEVDEGRAEYALGVFDNRTIPGQLQVIPMVVGRLDLNFGEKEDAFRDAHFGDKSWYSIGLNGSYQGGIENTAGARDGSNAAVGVDGMIDVPAGSSRLLARGEFNTIQVKSPAGGNPVDTRVWMAGLGLLVLNQRLQPFVRFDQVLLDDAAGGGSRNITYAGANFYQDRHKLKLQGDVRFEAGTQHAVDGGRLQAQLDF